jgi:hypothetical protein
MKLLFRKNKELMIKFKVSFLGKYSVITNSSDNRLNAQYEKWQVTPDNVMWPYVSSASSRRVTQIRKIDG